MLPQSCKRRPLPPWIQCWRNSQEQRLYKRELKGARWLLKMSLQPHQVLKSCTTQQIVLIISVSLCKSTKEMTELSSFQSSYGYLKWWIYMHNTTEMSLQFFPIFLSLQTLLVPVPNLGQNQSQVLVTGLNFSFTLCISYSNPRRKKEAA